MKQCPYSQLFMIYSLLPVTRSISSRVSSSSEVQNYWTLLKKCFLSSTWSRDYGTAWNHQSHNSVFADAKYLTSFLFMSSVLYFPESMLVLFSWYNFDYSPATSVVNVYLLNIPRGTTICIWCYERGREKWDEGERYDTWEKEANNRMRERDMIRERNIIIQWGREIWYEVGRE